MSKLFYKGLGKTETWPDISTCYPTSLTYDDVLLVPQSTTITSRSAVDTSVTLGPFTLRLPVITAPMDTITGEKMVRLAAEVGGIGALPRGDISERLQLCRQFSEEDVPCIYAVGKKNGLSESKELASNGAKVILVDVANGGMQDVKELAKEIKQTCHVTVITGNIVSYTEALNYKSAGIDIARVGVGPGGFCTTRLVSGNGFPQFSAILDTASVDIPVIADGGIRYSGDAAKAIAAGAWYVMIGSLLAGTDETPGDVDENGMKLARGQASASYMQDQEVSVSEHRAAEGISTRVPTRGTAKQIFQEISGGLRSAMSYAGASTIEEFQKKALFTLVSASVQRENAPHILQRS